MANVKRLWSVAAITLVVNMIASVGARAADCSAQKGKTIFEDSFKDDSGGFEHDAQAKFGPSSLRLTLGKTEDNWPYVNTNFNATNGDYCVVATMPAPVDADNLAAIGMTILYVDDENMIAIGVFSDNTVQIERRSKGDSDLIFNEQNADIKAAPGAPIMIRAVVQDGTITTYVNDVVFKKIRVQVPDGADKFGLYVGLDKIANKDLPFDFKSLRVTAGTDGKN